MSLNHRFVLLVTAAVTTAVALAAGAAYFAVSRNLHDHLDAQIENFAQRLATGIQFHHLDFNQPRLRERSLPFPQRGLDSPGDAAILFASGALLQARSDITRFRPSLQALQVAQGRRSAVLYDSVVAGAPARVYVRPAGRGRAVIAEAGLGNLYRSLRQLAVILVAIVLAGVLAAVFLAWLVVRIGTKPVRTLWHATEHVAATGDLSRRISTHGNDDLGRLGRSFNTMLASLEESQRAQTQLVGDASHELRTPISSMRTNLEVLLRGSHLGANDRAALLADLVEEAAQLGVLVDDLLDTARTGGGEDEPVTCRLDQLIADEVERVAASYPQVSFETRLERSIFLGRDARLKRAASNLLENAAKWSPAQATVYVRLRGTELQIRDEGPGFSDADLPYVFDRFYRAADTQGIPGAGLGLSIVRKVAHEHGGDVSAANHPEGGAILRLTLPDAQEWSGQNYLIGESVP